MWLGLLGTLHVEHDDAVVEVPAAKQRVVLAALVMRPNRVVSFDELTDAVWGDGAPPAARATLRNYIKRLRRGLGPQLAARIQTRDPGYRFDLAEAELDLAQFTRLCEAGGAAVQSGRWEQGGTLLGKALDLWRGAPLSDVPSEALQRREVPRLEQLRLQAMEWRLEAQLHLGHHQEAVPQLRALITQFPLREGLHASLMLALYRCGRQADALAAYHDVRRMLVDELGVEPGQELQQLHQRILLRDRRLLPPATAIPGNRPSAANPPSPAGGTPIAGGKAADCFREALNLWRELGSPCDEATALSHWGDALAAAGAQQPARDAWRQALDILDSLHDPLADVVRAKLRGPGTAPD